MQTSCMGSSKMGTSRAKQEEEADTKIMLKEPYKIWKKASCVL